VVDARPGGPVEGHDTDRLPITGAMVGPEGLVNDPAAREGLVKVIALVVDSLAAW
jgi:hypothetical protein